jgi:DNA-binding transcriptional LysR family regulator
MHPSIKIDLLPMPRNINLSKREADTSVTLERPVDDRIVSSKLLEYRMQLYASDSYLRNSSPIRTIADLEDHRWIDYVVDLLFTNQQPSLRKWVSASEPFFRSTSMTAQLQAVRAGLGIAILPCFLGNSTLGLTPVLSDEIDIVRTFWLAAPIERRELFRVRAVWEYLRKVAEINADFLMGASSEMAWC